ncbi:MAG TPA: cyclic nucleotide-binding domain-containing protein [Elusimicrobiales bacterium]|nr:cyclic nucleotide-binding domain-containing protein [Elusimicrobiales bacterium]
MKKLVITDADSVQFTKVVKKIKLFASMNMGLMEKILNRIAYYQCDKGEKVCKQGGPGDAFYVVNEGKLEVSVREAFLFSRTLAHLGPGDCFGEMALLTREPRNATVTCEEDSKIFVLMIENFDQVLEENPTFATEMKKLAADRDFELKHK